MPRKNLRQAFAQHHACAFACAIEHGGRFGVVVEGLVGPVVHDHGKVEIIGADDAALAGDVICGLQALFNVTPAVNHSGRAVRQRYRCRTRGAGEAFLQATGDGVDFPGVDGQRRAADRGGGIHLQQHAVAAADLADLGQRLQHGGGGVALAQGQQARRVLLNRRLDGLGRENRAPLAFDHAHIGADASRDFCFQLAEAAETGHQYALPAFHQRAHHRFDGRARGTVDDESPFVACFKHATVQRHRLLHVTAELRVELPQQLGRHGSKHARIGIDGAGAHE